MRALGLRCLRFAACTWTPQVCKIMAYMAVVLGLGLLFYILLGLDPTSISMENHGLYGCCYGFRAFVLHTFEVLKP